MGGIILSCDSGVKNQKYSKERGGKERERVDGKKERRRMTEEGEGERGRKGSSWCHHQCQHYNKNE